MLQAGPGTSPARKDDMKSLQKQMAALKEEHAAVAKAPLETNSPAEIETTAVDVWKNTSAA